MAHTHDHDHATPGAAAVGASARRLVPAVVLNGILAVVQIVGGIAFGSVALLADAAHQAVDAVGLALALVAIVLASRPPSARRTYGWGRADALGAQISGLILLLSTLWVIYESVDRLRNPAAVSGAGVLILGAVGVAVNGISLVFLGHQGHVLSLKAARLHLLTDLAGSIAVVVAGAVIALTGWDRIDPLVSLAISAIVIVATVRLLRGAGDVLLDAAPANLDAAEIAVAVREQPGVLDVHHLHVWTLAPGRVALSAHVILDSDTTVHAAQERTDELTHMLGDRFGIDHVTLQVECHPCPTPAHGAE